MSLKNYLKKKQDLYDYDMAYNKKLEKRCLYTGLIGIILIILGDSIFHLLFRLVYIEHKIFYAFSLLTTFLFCLMLIYLSLHYRLNARIIKLERVRE